MQHLGILISTVLNTCNHIIIRLKIGDSENYTNYVVEYKCITLYTHTPSTEQTTYVQQYRALLLGTYVCVRPRCILGYTYTRASYKDICTPV